MTSPQKAKGDKFEREVRDWLIADEWPMVARIPAGATDDVGDFLLPADVSCTLDAKNHARLDLAGWVDRAATQAANARRVAGFVVVKRRGIADPAQSYVVTSLSMFSDFVHRMRGHR